MVVLMVTLERVFQTHRLITGIVLSTSYVLCMFVMLKDLAIKGFNMVELTSAAKSCIN